MARWAASGANGLAGVAVSAAAEAAGAAGAAAGAEAAGVVASDAAAEATAVMASAAANAAGVSLWDVGIAARSRFVAIFRVAASNLAANAAGTSGTCRNCEARAPRRLRVYGLFPFRVEAWHSPPPRIGGDAVAWRWR